MWFESEETRRLASSALIELLNDSRGCLNRVQADPPSGCNAFETSVVSVPKGAGASRPGWTLISSPILAVDGDPIADAGALHCIRAGYACGTVAAGAGT